MTPQWTDAGLARLLNDVKKENGMEQIKDGDLLDMDYINGLPQPFLGRELGGWWWPINDFEVQTGLLRIDVCGRLQVKHIGDFTAFRDGNGVEHPADDFYADSERAMLAAREGK